MSRRKREVVAQNARPRNKRDRVNSGLKTSTVAKQIGMVVIPLLLVLGTLAAISGKYKNSLTSGNVDSAASAIPAIQTGAPQLSKEYVYAGGKMLAAVDGTSNLAPNSISGKMIYGTTPANEAPQFVPQVYLTASVAGDFLYSMSDSTGWYQFPYLTSGASYTVTPTKGGTVNGITAFDATLVLRHVAAGGQGENALNSNQQLAGNTDGDNIVTAFDATQILRFVAANGWTGNTGQVGYWKFANAPRSYSSFSNTLTGENYNSILVGEVNGDWRSDGGSFLPSVYQIRIEPPSNTTAPRWTSVVVPVFLTRSASGTNPKPAVGSYSFQFTFDPAVLQPDSSAVIAAGTLSEGCFMGTQSSDGMVGVSASCPTPINDDTKPLAYLRFSVIGEAGTSTGVTTLGFQTDNNGAFTGMFQDPQGTKLGTMIGYGSFTVESQGQLAASDSFSNEKRKESSATVISKSEPFAPAAEQQQQQQAQQPETEEMQISLPANAAAVQGGILTIPVTLTNNNGREFSAFNFDVQFNPALLDRAELAIDTAGTLSSNCKVVEYAETPGRIGIAGACADDITASTGTLLKLRFKVTGQANNASQQARALKLQQIPRFENHHGKQIGVGRVNGSIR